MVSKELKKLNRRELVDIIYQLKKNEQQMQEQIADLENSLQEKRIRVSVAGSIAEAAMDVTNIFSTAQATADLYLQEISCMKAETEEKCAKMIEDARKRAEMILSDAGKQLDDLNMRYQITYKKWQELQAEIQAQEKVKQYEDIRNG